jgi:hypothetical protein
MPEITPNQPPTQPVQSMKPQQPPAASPPQVEPHTGMFSNLTNLSFKRSSKQAFGFYIAYLILIMLIAGLVGGFYSVGTGNDSFEAGLDLGTYIAAVSSVVISFAVLFKKNLLGNYLYLVLVVLSGILGLVGGGLLGLLPAAYLTTK